MTASNARQGPIVGREKDLAALDAALGDPGVRLVTLVGPGGIGKTALALELAAQLGPRREGARSVVVDLGGASTITELQDRVVTACGVVGADAAAAIDALGDAVVVLDDFDSLVSTAAPVVSEWLAHAPEARFLVTSRERLGIAEENVYELGPLDPSSAGIAVLLGAARRAMLGFVPRSEDGAVLAEIAATVEGFPLALELAGARLPLLGPRVLLAELRGGIALERRTRGGPARHASIHAAVRGSWEALGPSERDALARLTVFRGGFTVASARAVLESRPDPLATLEALHARSLVRVRDAATARLDFYAQVRDFVVAANPGPIADAAERHARWFVAETERVAARAHVDPHARHWLVSERENLLEVARRVLSGGMPTALRAEPALRVLVAAKDVLLCRGPAAELAGLVSPILERTRDSGVEPRLSARVTLLRGALRRERGDLRASLKDLLAAESIARALADELLGAEAALELGKTLRAAGELEPARHSFDRAARAFADAGARVGEAEAIALLGATAGEAGDLATARSLCERAVAMAGDDRLLGAPLWLLVAHASAEGGDRSSAGRAAAEAERRGLADDDVRTASYARMLQGLVHHDGGDLDAASTALATARDRLLTSGDRTGVAMATGHLGAIAREEGRGAAAYAALAAARDVTLRARRPGHAAYFAAHLAGIEAALGRDAAASHILDGIALDRETNAWWPLSALDCVNAQRAASTSGSTDDPKRARGLFARIFARTLPTAPGAQRNLVPLPSEDALVVGAGGIWFRPPRGARVGLERRRSLALLLDHLATVRSEQPGITVRAATLFGVAWPGEKALASAAAHRVRVAVATLRKMGLRDALVTTPDGYGLSADVELVRA
jgi:predicted ATPase